MSSKSRWMFCTVGLLALGGGAAWILSPDAQTQSPSTSALPTAPSISSSRSGQGASTAALQREVGTLRGQLAQLQTEVQAQRNEAKGSEAPRSYSEGEAAERERTQKLAGFLDDHLKHEPTDPQWSPVARAEVEQRFGPGKDDASRVSETYCQSSMCRVEATHSSNDAEQSFLMGLTAMPSFHDSEAFTERYEQNDGSVKTRTFITRSGDHLPDPGML